MFINANCMYSNWRYNYIVDMFSPTEGIKKALDMFPQTERNKWICFHKRELAFDVLPILSCHVETVCLLTKKA